MEYGRIRGIAKPVSRVVLGTANLRDEPVGDCLALLDAVFAAGCNAFDTAHLYGCGASERALGRWIATRGVRDQVVVITKGAHPDGRRNRINPQDIHADLSESLDRLGMDRVDLYLLHRDDLDVPVGEIVDCLDGCRRDGLIGAMGGSNWTAQRIAQANRYAAGRDIEGFVASSPQYSLLDMVRPPCEGWVSLSGQSAAEDREYYRQSQVAVLCFTPLANALCAGVNRPGDRVFGCQTNGERLARLGQLARQKGCPMSAVAIAYLLAQPMNTYPIVGCSSAGHFHEAAAGAEVELSAREADWLACGDEAGAGSV